MKSVLINEAYKVSVMEVDEPIPAGDEVLLEIYYIGLCGSDLSSYKGTIVLEKCYSLSI